MKNSLLLFVVITVVSSFTAAPAFAQVTDTWNGTGADWNTLADWNSAVPTSIDTAVFDSTGAGQLNVTLSAPGTVENIQFNDPSSEYVIGTTTGPAITLTNGGTTGITYGNYPDTIETIDAPLILGDTGANETYTFANTVNNVPADVLNFNGSINGAAGSGNITTLNISNITTTINGAIGDGANGGQLALTFGNDTNNVTLTGANTYTGDTTITNNSTINVTGSLGNTAIFDNAQGTLNLNATGAVSQNVITVSGGVLTGSAVNAITGSAGLTVAGGTATITEAQNYTGPTLISGTYYNDGTNNPGNPIVARTPSLIISGSGSLGNTAVTVNDADSYPGWLELNAAGAISQNTLTIDTGYVTQGVAGAITGTTTVNINESGGGSYSTIGEAFFGDGNTYTGVTTLDGNNANITLNITQLADGGSASSIGASSNAASNLIFSGGTLQATNLTSAQSTDRLFTLGDSSSYGDYSTSSSAILDSSSADPADTLSFTNTGAIVSGLVAGQYAAAPGIILTGSNTGANTFAPFLSNLYDPTSGTGTTLTKNGTGNWILTNANTFSGNTTINGGTLQLDNFNAIQFSPVVLASADGLTFGAGGTYNIESLTGSVDESIAGGVTLGLGPQVGFVGNVNNTYTYSGSLSGAGGVAERGALDTQLFAGSNTYTGGTTVNTGTLETVLTASGTPFGTGSLILNGGVLEFAPSANAPGSVTDPVAVAYTAASDSGATLTYGSNGTLLINAGLNGAGADGANLTTGVTVTLGDGTDPALARSGTGTLIIQADATGAAGTLLGTTDQVKVNGTAPTLVNGIVSNVVVSTPSGTGVQYSVFSTTGSPAVQIEQSTPLPSNLTIGSGFLGSTITAITYNPAVVGTSNAYWSVTLSGNANSTQNNGGVVYDSGAITNFSYTSGNTFATSTAASLPATFGAGATLSGFQSNNTVVSVTGTPGNWIINLSFGQSLTVTDSSQNYDQSSFLDFVTYNGSNGFEAATSSYTNLGSPIGTNTTYTTTAGEVINVTSGEEYNGETILDDTGDNPYALRTAPSAYVYIAGGTTLTIGDGTNPAMVIINGGGIADGGNSVLNFGTLQGEIFADNSAEIAPVISGTGGLVISGSGSYDGSPGGAITLDNNGNTFSGGITLNAGAILAYGNQYSMNSAQINGTLGDPNNVITLNGGSINADNSLFGIGRTVNVTSLGGSLSADANYAANITGSGGLTIGTYQEYGTNPAYYNYSSFLALTGNNTFTGGLILYNDYLEVASNASLGADSSPITFDGGYIAVMGDSMTSFTHPLTFVPTNEVALDIEDANNTFTLSQALNQGTGGFAKMGSGTLVLTGANTYTGATGVYGGTLKVDESQGGSISSNSALFFDGGTLDILGNSTGATVQTFNGVTMGMNNNTSDATTGGGTLIVDSNSGDGTQSTTVNLGALNLAGTNVSNPNTVNYGSGAQTGNTLDIAVAGNGTATVTTTTGPDLTGIYGGRIVYTDSTGTNWATSATSSSGSTYILTGLGESNTSYSYTSISNIDNETAAVASTNNLLVTGGNDGTDFVDYWSNPAGVNETTNTLAFNSLKIDSSTGSAQSLDIVGFDLVLNSGGLLYTGSDDYTIMDSDTSAPGYLASGLLGTSQNGPSGTGDDLIIQQYGTGTLTISAVIADGADGPSTLTKAGPGTLILSGVNTYTGQTFVNGGILSAGAADNISGARLNLNGGAFEATGSFTLPSVYLGSAGGALNATGSNVLTVTSIDNFVGGGNQGPAGLTINSDGSTGTVFLDYTGNLNGNVFYGGITIDGGTLSLASYDNQDAGALGNVPVNYISWGAGSSGDLQLNGYPALVAGLESTSADAVVEDGSVTNTNSLLAVSNGDDETFAGTLVDNVASGLTGKLSFLKAGGGALSFTNAGSSYTGTTELDGGILNVALLADGGVDSSIGASTNAASNLIFGGGALQYTGSADQTTDRLFTLGDTGVGGNDGTIDSSGAGTVSFTNTGDIALANTGVHNLTLTGSNTGANTFAPVLGDSTYDSTPFATSLSKTGTGSWALLNANSYSGGTTVSGGTLYANYDNSVTPGSSTGTGTVAVTSGGTLSGTGAIAPAGANGITLAAGGNLAPGGVQSGSTVNGSLTLDTTNIAPNSTILAAGKDAGLTFAVGSGAPNDPATVSQLLVTGGVNNVMNFNIGGTSGIGGSSTVITINDLDGPNLAVAVDPSTEYILIVGNDTIYEDNGQTLQDANDLGAYNAALNGYQILGGLTLLVDGSNYFSENYPTSDLYLVGDDIVLAVPEPSTWALMLGGLGLLVFFQRRRRKQSRAFSI